MIHGMRQEADPGVSADDLCFTSAVELVGAIRRREISPVEIVTMLLAHIDRVNPPINAFVTVNADGALAAAQQAADELMSTPVDELPRLHGLPVTVKDLTPTAGVRTTYGSKHHADNVPTEDGLIWARLKAGGALLLGKTTTPEFGELAVTESPLTGITNNPWDLTRTVGGSSGGAAASLAAGMGPLATGSDGGGSIRVPAAYCGVVGLKPSLGRIPIYSEQPIYDDVDVVGPMSRTVTDAALMLSVVAGPHPHDPYSLLENGIDYVAALEGASLRGVRIGFSRDLGAGPVEPEVTRALEQAAGRLQDDCGAIVEEVEVSLPDPLEYFLRFWPAFMALELDAIEGDDSESNPIFVKWAKRAHEQSAVEFVRNAVVTRGEVHRVFAELFMTHDLLLWPTVPSVAFPHPGPAGGPLEVAGQKVKYPEMDNQRYTEAISHAGYPAITVPCDFSRDGLPIGMQLAAGHGADAAVLRAAAVYEAAFPWADRRPPLL
jgi:Asp-tRNA(Asn)/Glu-tRNA(Gln) amidotransferase A subunit family amidase